MSITIQRRQLAITLFVIGVILPFIGGFSGCVYGVAQGSAPAASGPAHIFHAANPQDPMPTFWVIQYPTGALISDRPRLIELTDPDINNPDWTFQPPAQQTPRDFGPWSSTSITAHNAPSPYGSLHLYAGGVSFQQTQPGTLRAELILYPTDLDPEWARVYYIYDITSEVVTPSQAYYELRPTSEFFGFSVMGSAILGTIIGTATGCIFILCGLIAQRRTATASKAI